MTNYPFNVAMGATLSINSQSTFVYYESASAGGADTSIKIVTDTGSEFVLKVGQGARLQKNFKLLYLSNFKGQGAIIGNLVLSEGDFVDHRVVGTVDVVDGGKGRSLSGAAYTAHMFSPANAGFYSVLQLWNPVGSGKNLVIDQIGISIPNLNMQFLISNAVLSGSLPSVVGNKKSGGGSPTSIAYWSNTSAVPQISNSSFSAIQGIFKPSSPFVIGPGFGLNMGSPNMGVSAGIDAEFFEEPI